ncbi:MAG TPA: hypothetical protein ENN89_03380 [Synergistetes bacterium]|nr:hypothetical protein [Synergistota bacterium]
MNVSESLKRGGRPELLIVTNNPRTAEKFPDSLFVEGSPPDVISRAGELLSGGFVLLSSPLPPNGRLMKNPYRSVALAESKELLCGGRDFILVSDAVERFSRLVFLPKEGKRGEDLAFMDLHLLEVAIRE